MDMDSYMEVDSPGPSQDLRVNIVGGDQEIMNFDNCTVVLLANGESSSASPICLIYPSSLNLIKYLPGPCIAIPLTQTWRYNLWTFDF